MATCGQNSLIRKNASTAIQKNTCPKQISILHSLSMKIQTIKLSSFKKSDEGVDAINFEKSCLKNDRQNQEIKKEDNSLRSKHLKRGKENWALNTISG